MPVRALRPRAVALLALLSVAALAGCASKAGGATASNFELVPDRIGWNVGEVARFTLTVKPTTFSKAPNYTIDRDFAIEEIALKVKAASLGGSASTRNADDFGLRLWRDGEPVDEAVLAPGSESVVITLTLPEKLRDAQYVLELRLFQVGWVSSAPFRVNVP